MGYAGCVADGETVVRRHASLSTYEWAHHGTRSFPETNDACPQAAEYDAGPRDEGEDHEASAVCFEVGCGRRVVWGSTFCWRGGSFSGPAECDGQAQESGAARDRPRGDGRAH